MYLFEKQFSFAHLLVAESLACANSELDCGHSVCINDAWRCDYIKDCLGGQDEQDCGKKPTTEMLHELGNVFSTNFVQQ